MTKVLITGCTGFIGSALTTRLVEEGYDVYGLVRHVSKKDLTPLATVIDKVHLIEGDLAYYQSVGLAVRSVQPESILHLGALTPVRLSFEDPFPYIRINFEGTVNLVHAILENMPKARLVMASTAEVYGWQDKKVPFEENLPLGPASPYAVSKMAGDLYTQMAIRTYGLDAVVLRPNNTYGRRNDSGFIVEYLITSMLRNQTCFIGTPNSVRDYMFVDDHVAAYLLALKQKEQSVFNVSPGNPVTNLELAEMIADIAEFGGKIVTGSYPPGYPSRPAIYDPEYLVLDSKRIREVLGWKPSVTLEDGLRKTVECWRNICQQST